MAFLSIIITLLIFTVIVVAHEYGHFLAARKNNILVEEFAVGMGPMVFGRKKGDTLYSIRLFPIGGYCKMLGEDGSDPSPKSFGSKKVWQRIVVCLSGVAMNFLLAVVLGSVFFSFYWFRTTTITNVIEGYPAYEAGLLPGDKILEIDGKAIRTYDYLGHTLNKIGSRPVEVVFVRDGSKMSVQATPAIVNEDGVISFKLGINTQVKNGIFNKEYRGELPTAGVFETVHMAYGRSLYYVRIVVDSLVSIFRREVSLNDIAGPIGVGQIVESNLQASAESNQMLLDASLFSINLAMLLSANLAVMNLLPIPALDGGRILFLLIEAVRRRPMDPEKEGIIHLIGFALVMVLAVVVALNDVMRLF